MCSLDTAVVELIPTNLFINDGNYRVRQRGERWSKNKISSFIIFIGRQSILRYIILDGVEFCKRFSARLRIPGASTFAFGFTHTPRWRFQHGDPRRLSAKQKRSLRRELESLAHDSQLENGQIADCPNVPVNPIRKSFSNSVFQSARARI